MGAKMSKTEARKRECNISIFGSCGVGKSALGLSFVNGRFSDLSGIDHYDEFYYSEINFSDFGEVIIGIGEAPGEPQFPSMLDTFIKYGHGFILVYSITSQESFQKMVSLLSRISEYAGMTTRDIPLVVVGNKCDLEDERTVTVQQGQALAAEKGVIFLETSAKTMHNVNIAFHKILHEVLNREIHQH